MTATTGTDPADTRASATLASRSSAKSTLLSTTTARAPPSWTITRNRSNRRALNVWSRAWTTKAVVARTWGADSRPDALRPTSRQNLVQHGARRTGFHVHRDPVAYLGQSSVASIVWSIRQFGGQCAVTTAKACSVATRPGIRPAAR